MYNLNYINDISIFCEFKCFRGKLIFHYNFNSVYHSVHFIHDVEYSNDTITSAASKLITTVAEINCKASSTESSDLGTRLEHIVSIEYFYFICTRTTWNYKITCVLLELGSIDETRLVWWKALIPVDVLNMLTWSKVPKLELLVILIWASKDKAVMQINGISANIWSIDRSTRTWLSDIPHFNIFIPTSWNNQVWIFLVKFDHENSVTMARFSWTSTFKINHLLSSLLVINCNSPWLSTCTKLSSIWVIITAKKLISSSRVDCVEKFSWSGMPVLECTVSIYRNDNILGYSHALGRSPSNLSCRHWLFHIGIQSIGLLSSKGVKDSNTTITASLCNIFVIWFVSDTESLGVEGA